MTEQLITRIAKAALDVGGKLSADRTNKEQSYDYLSADKILSVCGQALFNQGVVVIPNIGQQDTILFEYVDQYGKQRRRYDSTVTYQFTITDGATEEKYNWFGMGSDYTVPDKALYKAITSGHKYFLMKLLCIGAGNEDGEHEQDEEEKGKVKTQNQPKTMPKSSQETRTATSAEKTTNGDMTIEAAESEVSTTYKLPYGQIETEQLALMYTGMKKVKEPTDDQKRKIKAVDIIMAARAKGRMVQRSSDPMDDDNRGIDPADGLPFGDK